MRTSGEVRSHRTRKRSITAESLRLCKLSTLSQQLRILYTERMVERRLDGKHIYYRLAHGRVRDLVAAARAHASEHG